MTLVAGHIIGGRYRVQRFLGPGASGEVYEAFDIRQQEVIAIKLLKGPPAGGQWLEAQVLTQLRSPRYILPVRNADIAAGVAYITTELALHGSAADRMRPIGVPPGTAVNWVRAACRGTARTHDAGLLHRDIKPDNLFLRADGEALLGDFGLAALVDATGSAGPDGTPQTVAPEVPGGRTTVASDVYSLGATLYALLAGRYAHNNGDLAKCLAELAAGPGPRLRDLAPHVGQALAKRVEKAVERNPADRYANPIEFDAALGSIPRDPRAWVRTDEHANHDRCYRGTAKGAVAATVCAAPVGPRFEIQARHQPSNRRIGGVADVVVPPGRRASALRVAMRDAS